MNTGLKYTLITLGVLGTGVGLYFLLRKPKNGGSINNPIDDLFRPSSPTRYVSDSFPLKRDSGGSRVRVLQTWLNDTYGTSLVVDGKFGPKTEAALESNTGLKEVSESYYNSTVTSSSTSQSNQQPVDPNDKDGDGVPDSIDIDAGTGTGQPVFQAFDGMNENIEISDNTITNFDETAPSFYASGLFINDDY